jgi:hypothetical protein
MDCLLKWRVWIVCSSGSWSAPMEIMDVYFSGNYRWLLLADLSLCFSLPGLLFVLDKESIMNKQNLTYLRFPTHLIVFLFRDAIVQLDFSSTINLLIIQSCPGGAPGRTCGCIRSAAGWCCIPPPPPLLAWRGESLLHMSSPVKETVQ